jgi:hypothetical protein
MTTNSWSHARTVSQTSSIVAAVETVSCDAEMSRDRVIRARMPITSLPSIQTRTTRTPVGAEDKFLMRHDHGRLRHRSVIMSVAYQQGSSPLPL